MVISYYLRVFKLPQKQDVFLSIVMNNSTSIDSLLKDHNISADEFLSTQNISTQVRSHLKKFINYCRTHKTFTVRMIELAFNSTYSELQNNTHKKASHTANQILSNEEPEVASLFFEPPPKPQDQQTEIQQVIDCGIKSQAEKLFSNDSEQEEPVEDRAIQVTQEELVDLSLQILKNPQKNETCVGHLQKMFSYFIRHEPIPVLDYFQKHYQVIKLMFNNLQYSSISNLLAQLLTSQDKNKEYKHQTLKKRILQESIQSIFLHIDHPQYFDGALIFLEQILNSAKQSYYEYFQDFKRISNYLVCNKILDRFYQVLLQKEQTSFINVSKFLEILFQRINSETEDNKYYHKEQNQPSMNFEIDTFLQNVQKLLCITSQIHQFKSVTKIHYLSFLEALLQTPKLKNDHINLNSPCLMALFESYKQQNKGGISKNKIYNILHHILAQAPQEQLQAFLSQHPNLYELYFTSIKQANYSNTKNYNKNQTSAYDISLISDLTRKEETSLKEVSKVLGKDFKRICKKYDTKIATFTNNSTLNFDDEEDKFQRYKNEEGRKKDEEQNGNSIFGKNNISIPILQLPDRFRKKEETEERSSREESKEVVEEEQVIVLTNQLDKLEKDSDMPIQTVINQESPKKAPQPEPTQEEPSNNKVGNITLHQAKALPQKVRFYTRHLVIFA